MNKEYNYQETKPVELLYILGAGHCGSTLLNLCLDRHSAVVGVSEIITLNRKSPGWSGDKYVLDEKYWSEVDRVMQEKYNKSLTEVPFNLKASLPFYSLALQSNKEALEAILEISKKSIISDASKNSKRLEVLLQSKSFKVRVIYLVRDGRAIVHAYLRKYKSCWPGLYNLISTDRAARRLMAKHGSKNWLTIRYEDMATDLEGTMRNICSFSKINYESLMLHPDTSNFNGLGGNRLIKRPIDKIILDNVWQTEMPRITRSFTSIIVSKFNRRHGYKN